MDEKSEAYQKALIGAQRSAQIRRDIAKEEVLEEFTNNDGSHVEIRETVVIVRNGRRRVTVPIDILDYPIVYEFTSYTYEQEKYQEVISMDYNPDDEQDIPDIPDVIEELDVHDALYIKDDPSKCKYDGWGEYYGGDWEEEEALKARQNRKELENLIDSITVTGSMKGIKHRTLRAARSGNISSENGIPRKVVLIPDEIDWYVRLQYWTDILEADIRRREEKRRRFSVNGETDLVTIERNAKNGEGAFIAKINGHKVNHFEDPKAEFLDSLVFTDAMNCALGQLDDIDRTIFTMHYFNDFPFNEIAKKLGKSNSTISYRLHNKILPTMRTCLKALGYDK